MELLVCALERELEVSSVVAVSDCSAGLGEVDTCSDGSLCFSLGVLQPLYMGTSPNLLLCRKCLEPNHQAWGSQFFSQPQLTGSLPLQASKLDSEYSGDFVLWASVCESKPGHP